MSVVTELWSCCSLSLAIGGTSLHPTGLPVDAQGAAEGLERVHNTAALEVLRKLPGVTDANVRNVLRECASLAELASLSMERMTSLLGGRAAAERLHRFLNQSPKALLEGLL